MSFLIIVDRKSGCVVKARPIRSRGLGLLTKGKVRMAFMGIIMARSFKSSFTGVRSTFNFLCAAGAVLFLPVSVSAQAPQTALAVTVRHAPGLNGNGLIEGSLQQLLGEDVTLNGGFVITGDLLEPGTPALRVNGHPTIAGTVAGSGSASPGGYTVLLNGNCSLNYLRTRTTPVSLPVVPLPPQPGGARNVTINNPGQSIGDAATLRNLTLNGNAGSVAIPPGTYGAFTANGGCAFTLGVAGGALSSPVTPRTPGASAAGTDTPRSLA